MAKETGREVLITGVGPVSGLGLGIEPTWENLTAAASAIGPLEAFDVSAFDCHIGAEIKQFKVRDFVPKSYRKATKVMARDIELAVAAADLAARDAKLDTRATNSDSEPSYAPARIGAHIGAGLIACDMDELTAALVEARNEEDGSFDMHKWGTHGMGQLTPLWLLKYLPNMLACHVTIVHDAQGPSNTITCNEASGMLSLGESIRAIQRGVSDAGFCGGTDSKLNPMALLRQQFTGRLTDLGNENPDKAVRPFAADASGGALGEGGGILILEARDTFEQRNTGEAYASVAGFASTQTVNRESRNLKPDAEGRGIASAINGALRDADTKPEDIDLIVPFGCGDPTWDQAECSALRTVFGDAVAGIPITPTKPLAGNCTAGAGALDLCIAAQAIKAQQAPAVINCDEPLDLLYARARPAEKMTLNNVLAYATGLGGQNAAVVLKKV